MNKLTLAILTLLLTCNAQAQTRVLYADSLDAPPNKIIPYVHATYEYEIYLGCFDAVMSKQDVIAMIVMVDNAFGAWGGLVQPIFTGTTLAPPAYNDGKNTISFGVPLRENGEPHWGIKGLATKDVEGITSDEGDILLTTLSSWAEFNIEVTIEGSALTTCSARQILYHEVGHVLGVSHTSRTNNLMAPFNACMGPLKMPSNKHLRQVRRSYKWLRDNRINKKIIVASSVSDDIGTSP